MTISSNQEDSFIKKTYVAFGSLRKEGFYRHVLVHARFLYCLEKVGGFSVLQ